MTMHRPLLSTALGLVMAAGTPGAFAQDEGDRNAGMERDEPVALGDFDYEALYAEGRSVQRMIETLDVDGTEDEDIGEVEDFVVGPDGNVMAVIIEIGGFLDIGDTHIAVRWSEVDFNEAGDGISVPVSEDNVGEYGLFDQAVLDEGGIDEAMSDVDDTPTGERSFRASELIGDYARIRAEDTWADYGYVSDLILHDGKLASVVITPDVSYGVSGYYATPYYGYGTPYGFTAGANRYNLPYDEIDFGELEPFQYDRMAS